MISSCWPRRAGISSPGLSRPRSTSTAPVRRPLSAEHARHARALAGVEPPLAQQDLAQPVLERGRGGVDRPAGVEVDALFQVRQPGARAARVQTSWKARPSRRAPSVAARSPPCTSEAAGSGSAAPTVLAAANSSASSSSSMSAVSSSGRAFAWFSGLPAAHAPGPQSSASPRSKHAGRVAVDPTARDQHYPAVHASKHALRVDVDDQPHARGQRARRPPAARSRPARSGRRPPARPASAPGRAERRWAPRPGPCTDRPAAGATAGPARPPRRPPGAPQPPSAPSRRRAISRENGG